MSLVYYHKEKDMIFESRQLDAYFFGLCGCVRWDLILILGEL
jgi:hypothetical protein